MNGQNKNGSFESDQTSLFLGELKKHKSICWYPSAGSDFRTLLYLSKPYYEKHEELAGEKAALPDLFIMTDYQKHGFIDYSDSSNYVNLNDIRHNFDQRQTGTLKSNYVLYYDAYTSFTIKTIRKFELNDVEASNDLTVDYYHAPSCYGQAYCMTIKVDSRKPLAKKLGAWEIDVIYLYIENTTFAKRILLQNRINIDYIVMVRYPGYGNGASGIWLFYLADLLNVKYYVTNQYQDKYIAEGGADCGADKEALEFLKGDSEISFKLSQRTPLYKVEWYRGEVVVWYRVER